MTLRMREQRVQVEGQQVQGCHKGGVLPLTARSPTTSSLLLPSCLGLSSCFPASASCQPQCLSPSLLVSLAARPQGCAVVTELQKSPLICQARLFSRSCPGCPGVLLFFRDKHKAGGCSTQACKSSSFKGHWLMFLRDG